MARQGLNQRGTVVRLARESRDVVAVPASVTLNEEEALLWPVFASARAAGDWCEFDLVLLAKAVQLEVVIRAQQQRLNKEGPLVTTARGALKANPLCAILDTLQRQQLTLIRSLRLTSAGDPRTQASRAEKSRRLAAFDDEDGLLARPWSAPNGKKQPGDG